MSRKDGTKFKILQHGTGVVDKQVRLSKKAEELMCWAYGQEIKQSLVQGMMTNSLDRHYASTLALTANNDYGQLDTSDDRTGTADNPAISKVVEEVDNQLMDGAQDSTWLTTMVRTANDQQPDGGDKYGNDEEA